MIKNKSNLAIKLFIAVWIVLALHITLKLTFNYWQPYVIPNDTLQVISDYIDTHRWIEATLNGILYMINGLILVLCGLRRWWFEKKIHAIVVISSIVLGFIYSLIFKDSIINTIVITIIIPILIDKRKWWSILITFGLTNIFLLLSLFLEGFVNTNDMQYICKVFLQFDYYIMLVLNYFVFNLIKVKKVK